MKLFTSVLMKAQNGDISVDTVYIVAEDMEQATEKVNAYISNYNGLCKCTGIYPQNSEVIF